MGTIKDTKYKLIKNFLTPEESSLAKKYLLMKHKENTTSFGSIKNGTHNGDTQFFKDFLSEALLFNKLSLIEKETGLKLFPTYSFTRLYTYNAILKKHTDRPSCEISVTVMFGSDQTPWPIYMNDNPIEMNEGDACIYMGCEIPHFRKNFTGDWHAQAFLHYVDQNGPYADWKYDKMEPPLHPSLQS